MLRAISGQRNSLLFIQTFTQSTKACQSDGRTLSHRLANFLLSTVISHATTNRSPASLSLNRTLRTRFSLLNQNVWSIDKHSKKNHINKHAKMCQFEIGDKVMVQNRCQPGPKWIPGKIVMRTGPISYVVQTDCGLKWKCHVDHITLHHIRMSQAETNTDYTAGSNSH